MKQKTGSKLLGVLLALVMIIGLMPGMSLTAYAAEKSESFTTNKSLSTYTGEYFTITCTNPNDGDGFYLNETNSATISAKNGEIITKVEFTKGAYSIEMLQSATGTVTYNGDVATVSGVNATSLTVNAIDHLQIKAVKVYYTIAHTHSFSYNADGATITATCKADGCDLPESSAGTGDHVATLTIAASGGTYDGTTAYGATITDANSIQGDAKVQYQKKTGGSYGTATDTAPTDAGDYKASITVGGATASVEYNIAKADQTAPTGFTATKASSSTATDGKISGVNDTMEYQKDGDTSWIAVANNKTEITGLTSGTYKVRYAETADKNASDATWRSIE